MHQNKRGGKDFSFHSYILLILDKESQPQMKTASENELMVMMMVPFRRKSGKERPHQQRRKESQLRFHTRRKAFAFFCFFFFWFNQSTILISLLFHSSYLCLGNDIVFFTGETKLMQRWWWWIQQVQKQIRLESSIELTNLKANFTYYKKKKKKENWSLNICLLCVEWGVLYCCWCSMEREREREREQWMKGDKLILLWFWDSRKNRGETKARENTVCVLFCFGLPSRAALYFMSYSLYFAYNYHSN